MAPAVGNRLLPHIVDSNAEADPSGTFGLILRDNNIPNQWIPLIKGQLAQAVNHAAWWFDQTVTGHYDTTTVAYMGPNDIRYVICAIALAKVGYKTFLPSTRNSAEANAHLLRAVGCNYLLWGGQSPPAHGQALVPDLQVWKFPSLDELLTSSVSHYPYRRTYQEAEDETFVILHSSGTTATKSRTPETRPIDTWIFLRDGQRRTTRYSLGLYMWTMELRRKRRLNVWDESAIPYSRAYHNHRCHFPRPPDNPLLLQAGHRFHTRRTIDTSSTRRRHPTIPTTRYEHDITGAKDALKDRLIPCIGSTELGHIPPTKSKATPEDWKYYQWPYYPDIHMELHEEGLYEMVIRRSPNSRLLHGVFHVFPELQEWRTKDLFSKHPTENGWWRFESRTDDIIVLGNGEKVNPIEMEAIIERHDLVHKAMIAGRGLTECVLLVEPDWDRFGDRDLDDGFMDEIWDSVESANKQGPGYAYIEKDRIGIASREKPFQMNAKGILRRALVCKDYESEISVLGDDDPLNPVGSSSDAFQSDDVQSFIRQVVSSVSPNLELEEDTDFFAAGLDSLQVIRMARIITRGISMGLKKSRGIHIDPQIIYRYCTIKSLSSYLADTMEGNVSNGEAEDKVEDVQATLKRITNKYTASLPKIEHKALQVPSQSNIILTGSTGSLGSYLLDVLLSEPSIKKRSSFHDRQLNVKALLSPKAEFLTTNLDDKTLGLSQSKYNELLNKIDAIVHNAWKVDFNLSVHSFEKGHIRGTRNLLDLSLSSRKTAHMYFVSSIATTSGWGPSRGKIPENILPDTVEPPLQGYGQSKYVAENICLAASTRSGVPVTILRVGQVAGPTTKSGGYWNPDEWFPSLVFTSKSMGSIPESLGMPVEWIPVVQNTLAQVVLEIIQCGQDGKKSIPASVINLVNPTRTTWATLLPTIQGRIGANPVSLQSWVRTLGETDAVNVENRPAYKLLSFYERLARSNGDDSFPQSETNKASAASPTFRALGPIDSSLVQTWLDQWVL
ncbi:hypothetical protein BDV30DRAFT_226948 [Aspergillus minisclerotigenes]|uniref:Carrier domain-containing protein n=1 Tax=Aspergillus minisclerotigenes TaxID=656917 RepID=A0A5N6J5H9_9EURO|nr:hypothetical protein BDV30DRAFT_226948 [Aspergillus minisclerotigenes]